MLKESSLETIGYICQDIDARALDGRANDVLTAIVHGMRPEEVSANVRLAATTALLNSLEFTKTNFENEAERNIIMQVVCESTNSSEQRVKVASLQCLVRIMQLYYDHMLTYMQTALFQITLNAMKSDEAEVSMQGMEFWSTVAEEEFDLALDYEDAVERGETNAKCNSLRFMEQAAAHVVPVLLEAMAHHDDGDDEDEWTPAKAAGVCLMLAAQCVRDDIVNHVIPFFKHFQNPDWKYKEAAIMAFGSIFGWPRSEETHANGKGSSSSDCFGH
uniref:Importin N-terminal domain-containing protein n=1 Tax=Caenorhabditis japonica TaxID=281687 RepID=A0A8R1EQM7_CAEJA